VMLLAYEALRHPLESSSWFRSDWLVHPNFNYHKQEEVAKIGPLKATVDEEKTAQIRPQSDHFAGRASSCRVRPA